MSAIPRIAPAAGCLADSGACGGIHRAPRACGPLAAGLAPGPGPSRSRRGARRERIAASGPGDSDDLEGNFDEAVDIDSLARRLSEEAAERLRQKGASGGPLDDTSSMGIQDFSSYGPVDYGRDGAAGVTDGAGGSQSEAETFPEMNDEQFGAEDFELSDLLGYLSVKQMSREFLLGSSESASSTEETAVIAYVAKYFGRGPYQYPVRTLLKEYLPCADNYARNEVQTLQHLCGLPESKWKAAFDPMNPDPPVVPLLGYFTSAPSELALDQCPQSTERSLWLVYKWEALKPLSWYWEREQPKSEWGWPWRNAEQDAAAAKRKMLRAIFRGVIYALWFCHKGDVVHGSLGSGSVQISSLDDRDADSLVVKLDNFGLSRRLERQGSVDVQDDPIALGKQEDLWAVGRLFLETVIATCGDGQSPCPVSRESVERLTTDIFPGDFEGLRSYCCEDPDWSDAVEILGERDNAGWDLLSKLWDGKAPCEELLKEKFLKAT
eukprot:evm.model.scf_550.5 EVM.evm.TU.scf_550.5   scf_550:57649-62095(-)